MWSSGFVTSLAVVLPLFAACVLDREGKEGQQGPAGPSATLAGTSTLNKADSLPGLSVEIREVTRISKSGEKRSSTNIQPGDTLKVTFAMKKGDGKELSIDEVDAVNAVVSGPSSHYQLVVPLVSDLKTKSVKNADGSYSYTFASAIPPTYPAPLNDSASIGADQGELQGQPFLSGTYTLGINAYKAYAVEGQSVRDSGSAVSDFRVGDASEIEVREVVKTENCNQCHVQLQFHGNTRKDARFCVLCHTIGAEDKNAPEAEGGSPGVTIAFENMIHKIHNAKHLPSVLGVSTHADGSRFYEATPRPYKIVGFRNTVFDLSEIGFPVWPSLSHAMPADQGYSKLTATQKAKEDEIRRGVVACEKCHGDPDGSGVLAAPAQGDFHKTKPTRNACGSCHDDIDWTKPYTANGQTMPPQSNDSSCAACHPAAGTALAVADAHTHPLLSIANPGLVIAITALSESGSHNGDGTIDPGEKVAVTFTLKDSAGNEVSPSEAGNLSAVVSGPTTNLNLVLYATLPSAAMTGSSPYTVNLPTPVYLEKVGTSSAASGETFSMSRPPIYPGTTPSVYVRTQTGGGSSTLATATPPAQNYVDVSSSTGFVKDDFIAIDDGGALEEVLQIQHVDGNRLWFSSPGTPAYPSGPAKSHSSGVMAREVTLTKKTVTTDYILNASADTITEVSEFGASADVFVSYTADFMMPSAYPTPLNGSPDLGEAWGEWSGKKIVDGTYLVGVWGARAVSVKLFDETNTYRGTSLPAVKEVLVGSATAIAPYKNISSGQNCNACHSDVMFHGGGRRGFDTCILCHGSAGAEDRPGYVAPGVSPTTGVTINFRTMLHKIHMGKELTKATEYVVEGFGSTQYPHNHTPHTYGEIGFPVFPGGVKECSKCHGISDAWQKPGNRNHPDGQTQKTRSWMAACTSCHDSDATAAHADSMTSPNSTAESCEVCHGAGKEFGVDVVHKVR